MAAWFSREADGTLLLKLHIQPGAKQSAVMGEHGDALKLRVAAPPLEGRANEALVEFLARRLGVPRQAVDIRHGLSGRRKIVAVRGAAADPARLLAPD